MRKGMLVIVPLKYTGGNMWLELMQHIKSTIDNSGAAFNVMLGAMRPQAAKVDENGVIMIIRGETTRGDNSIQSELEQELYIEVWGRNDNPDLEVGYELMASSWEVKASFANIFSFATLSAISKKLPRERLAAENTLSIISAVL